jgi:multidrug efflux system membrane fusion protein
MVSITITLLILGGLGYIGWTRCSRKQAPTATRAPDLPVPVLAATPRIQDVPVYLDGVGAVRALNNVTVRSQVDGKLIAVNFTEGPGRQEGRRARRDRSGDLQGAVRSGRRQEGAG